jgi:hypothetical protein
MKSVHRSETNPAHRAFRPERPSEKGVKHEAFDQGRLACGQRGIALARRMDRKR